MHHRKERERDGEERERQREREKGREERDGVVTGARTSDRSLQSRKEKKVEVKCEAGIVSPSRCRSGERLTPKS